MKKKGPERSYSLAAFAWQRLRRDKLAISGIVIISIAILIAILGYSITPDASPDADTHVDEIGIKHPGFKCNLIRLKKNIEPGNDNFFSRMFFGEVNEYEYHAYKSTWFVGNDIYWEEYTEGPTPGKIWHFNLADAVYSIDPSNKIVDDTANHFVEFNVYGRGGKIHRTTEQLKEEVKANLI